MLYYKCYLGQVYIHWWNSASRNTKICYFLSEDELNKRIWKILSPYFYLLWQFFVLSNLSHCSRSGLILTQNLSLIGLWFSKWFLMEEEESPSCWCTRSSSLCPKTDMSSVIDDTRHEFVNCFQICLQKHMKRWD